MIKRCLLPTPIAEIKNGQLRAESRPCVKAKFLFVGEEKFYVRGATYGTFRPDKQGNEYKSRDEVERDFVMMQANGINSVRTYTVPPRWFLDAALRHGLHVMVGTWGRAWVFDDKNAPQA
jgi:beta-galactosidase/beta-glucuronidase